MPIVVSRTMQLSSGRTAETVDMRAAAEVIGCSIEDVSFWLDKGWIASVECGCCEAIYALLDDVLDIANLAVLDQATPLDEIVARRYDELHSIEMQRVSSRKTRRLPSPPQAPLKTGRHEEMRQMMPQQTRRLVPHAEEARSCDLTAYPPALDGRQDRSHRSLWPFRRSQSER